MRSIRPALSYADALAALTTHLADRRIIDRTSVTPVDGEGLSIALAPLVANNGNRLGAWLRS